MIWNYSVYIHDLESFNPLECTFILPVFIQHYSVCFHAISFSVLYTFFSVVSISYYSVYFKDYASDCFHTYCHSTHCHGCVNVISSILEDISAVTTVFQHNFIRAINLIVKTVIPPSFIADCKFTATIVFHSTDTTVHSYI